MIGTKAMLVARDDLHPALINLLIDAAREIHGRQGYFEAAGEFPGTAQVDDIPVSPYADQHRRFGPKLSIQLPAILACHLRRAGAHPHHPAGRHPGPADEPGCRRCLRWRSSLTHLSLVR